MLFRSHCFFQPRRRLARKPSIGIKERCDMTKPRRIWTGALAASLLAGMLGAGAAYAQCTPLAGEVGRWQAEGDAQDCVGGNHGTLLNGAGFDTGYDGQAFAV